MIMRKFGKCHNYNVPNLFMFYHVSFVVAIILDCEI